MKLTHFLASAMLLMASVPGLKAQELWMSAEGRVNITKDLRADIEVEHRSKDQFEATSRWDASIGASYKCLPWLRVSASYKFLYDRDGNKTTRKGNFIPAYWQSGHRLQVSATGSLNLGKFGFSLREAYQFTHFTEQYVSKFSSSGAVKDDEFIEAENRNLLRSRLQAEYKYKKKALVTPYASIELYNDFDDGFSVRKIRYTAGADFRIDSHNSISVFYRFIDRSHSDNTNAIGISYQFKL